MVVIGCVHHSNSHGSIITETLFSGEKSTTPTGKFVKIEEPTKKDLQEALDSLDAYISGIQLINDMMKELPSSSSGVVGDVKDYQKLLDVVELEKKIIEIKIAQFE